MLSTDSLSFWDFCFKRKRWEWVTARIYTYVSGAAQSSIRRRLRSQRTNEARIVYPSASSSYSSLSLMRSLSLSPVLSLSLHSPLILSIDRDLLHEPRTRRSHGWPRPFYMRWRLSQLRFQLSLSLSRAQTLLPFLSYTISSSSWSCSPFVFFPPTLYLLSSFSTALEQWRSSHVSLFTHRLPTKNNEREEATKGSKILMIEDYDPIYTWPADKLLISLFGIHVVTPWRDDEFEDDRQVEMKTRGMMTCHSWTPYLLQGRRRMMAIHWEMVDSPYERPSQKFFYSCSSCIDSFHEHDIHQAPFIENHSFQHHD